MANKVFMIQIEFSTDDDRDVEIDLFKDYKRAKERYFKIIEDEKNNTWIKNAFNGDVFDEENYEIETNIDDEYAYEYYWDIAKSYDWIYRTHIQLREMEVN